MKVTHENDTDIDAITDFFARVFADAEGAESGATIRALVQDLLTTTPKSALHVFCAQDVGQRVAAVAFSRLYFPQDPREVWMLSPMAVATDRQRQGVGQALIAQALSRLQSQGAEAAVTYGSPDYYGKVGFAPLTIDQVAAPLPLSMPFGWLGQSLISDEALTIQGPSTCVAAFNRPDVW